MEERHGTYRFEPPSNIPGGVMVISDADWFECVNCGEQIIPGALSRKLEELSMSRQGLLSSTQIKAIREKLGLSQAAMAERLGVGEKTYTRWESGRSIQNKSSDNLIRLMDRSPEQFAVIEAQRNPGRTLKIANYIKQLSQQEGQSQLGMAAHDADLTTETADRVREALRKAIKEQTQE
jgi:putative zinc finger/helix-turn-helix YgiT family protein